jgi:RNA polymerase sigma factor (sigma-70 family)
MKTNEEQVDLLLGSLEPHLPDSVQRYKHLRLNLVKYFAWKRCDDPEELADEVISRVIKKLSTGEEIYSENPYTYIYGIAKNVFREYLRSLENERDLSETLLVQHSRQEQIEDCRRNCLLKLSPEKLEILQEYYLSTEGREAQAQEAHISLNALRLQVHRIRQELRACQKDCLK